MKSLEVAKYILSKKKILTTLELQKLVYYSQAWNLVWEEIPLFEEDFEAWAMGPVLPELYQRHKGVFEVSTESFLIDVPNNCLIDSEKENIDLVLASYGDKSGSELSSLTHSEMPWKKAREKSNSEIGERSDEIITKESILN